MKRLSAAVALALSVLAAPAGGNAQNADPGIYAALERAGLLDRNFDAFLQPAFSTLLRNADIGQALQVNRPPQPDTLSVLIVDGKKLPSVVTDQPALKRLLPRIADNVLAVPPHTIVFDRSVVSALILNAFNDLLGLMQGLELAEKLGPRASDEALAAPLQTMAALADFLRYRNIRNDRENSDPDASSSTLAPMIAKQLANDPDLVGMFTMMFAPVLLHEMGHLRRGVTGTYEETLTGPLAAAAIGAILKEEDAADDFAIERMQRIIRKTENEAKKNARLKLTVQSAISTIKYMRDLVLEDTFDSFRGVHTEDLFINIETWDCNVRKDTEKLDFINPGKVRRAFIEYLPLLTRAEFDELREKIQRRVAGGTHSHHFARGDRFLEMIEREAKFSTRNLIGPSLVMLDSMMRNDPSRLYPDIGPGSTGLSFADLARFLYVEFTPAVNCPDGLCAVGRFTDRPGFIEVIGPMNDLRRVRITYPMLGPGRGSLNDNPEEYIQYMALGMRILANATGDKSLDYNASKSKSAPPDSSKSPAVQLLLGTRSMSLKCGAGFMRLPVGKRVVTVRTLNESNWVAIDIEPLPAREQTTPAKAKRPAR
jgi:hypothetical protein